MGYQESRIIGQDDKKCIINFVEYDWCDIERRVINPFTLNWWKNESWGEIDVGYIIIVTKLILRLEGSN